jgi:hypothetical protein
MGQKLNATGAHLRFRLPMITSLEVDDPQTGNLTGCGFDQEEVRS